MMLIPSVRTKTEPAELILTALADHVRAASVLVDDDAATRARLTAKELVEVGLALSLCSKCILDLKPESLQTAHVNWVFPLVLTDVADKVV